jgi:spore germination protein GerM
MSRGEPGSRPPLGRIVLWVLSGLVILAGASLLFWPRAIEPPAPPTSPAPGDAAPPARGVTLYFGDRDGRSLVTERRDLASTASLETAIEAVVQALIDGPEIEGAVRTIPEAARLRRVFVDQEAATAFLDFDPALVTQHPGGSAAEYATVATLVRTLGANFPHIVRVQILVDGQPVETLAGHFDTSKALEISTWE